MKNKITAGYIIFELEEFDWKRDWKNFLADFKKAFRGQFEYDPENKIWSLKATPKNQGLFGNLKKMYFEDENQEEIIEDN